MMNVSTQGLTIIGINTLEHDDSKVKNCSEKGETMEGEELLLLVIIHIVEETSVKTFMGN
jgi:hypothetical protein